MRLRLFSLPVLFLALPLLAQSRAREAPLTSPEERAALHRGPDWDAIAPHLPDPQTATAAQLETAADVLRARRFPEDALDFYGYAMARGGNVSELLNKMGVVRLELRQPELAREMFKRTVRAQKTNATAWNNLGVTEYSMGNFRQSVGYYKRAAKIDKRSAVYHSNLGMAYFELHDMETARKEFATALRLDPELMHRREGGGSVAHVVNTQNYPELCFEMARIYLSHGSRAEGLQWLAKAGESGYNVRNALRGDPNLQPLLKDPEVAMLLTNADQLRAKHSLNANAVPSLGPVAPASGTP